MKYAALVAMAILAILGGLALTDYISKERMRRRVHKKLAGLKPCSCGSLALQIHTDEETLIVVCEECGKIVRGPMDEAIKEWNTRNEVDEDE